MGSLGPKGEELRLLVIKEVVRVTEAVVLGYVVDASKAIPDFMRTLLFNGNANGPSEMDRKTPTDVEDTSAEHLAGNIDSSQPQNSSPLFQANITEESNIMEANIHTRLLPLEKSSTIMLDLLIQVLISLNKVLDSVKRNMACEDNNDEPINTEKSMSKETPDEETPRKKIIKFPNFEPLSAGIITLQNCASKRKSSHNSNPKSRIKVNKKTKVDSNRAETQKIVDEAANEAQSGSDNELPYISLKDEQDQRETHAQIFIKPRHDLYKYYKSMKRTDAMMIKLMLKESYTWKICGYYDPDYRIDTEQILVLLPGSDLDDMMDVDLATGVGKDSNIFQWCKNRLDYCLLNEMINFEQVYAIVHESQPDHWLLIVLDLVEKICYVLDSLENSIARRNKLNLIATHFLKNAEIFSNDHPKLKEAFIGCTGFEIIFPITHPQKNSHDCGMYVIKYMDGDNLQYWQHMDYTEFEMAVERMNLIASLITNPYNEYNGMFGFTIPNGIEVREGILFTDEEE